jgi:hypothetical protein
MATVLWLVWMLGERSREREAQRRTASEHRGASSSPSGEPSPSLERFDLLTTLSAVRRAIEVSSELQQRPATAEQAPAMRSWLSELARPLVEEGAELDRVLAELAARSPVWTEDRARELARREQSLRQLAAEHAERLAEAGPFGRGLSRAWPVFRRMREERAGLTRELAVALAEEEDRYVHEVLVELVAEIETLRSFSIPVVEARLAWAEEVRSRTVDRHANAWREAAEAIRVHPRYGGLALAPQVGLVPLGENPRSGLWEFAHVRSAATEELPAVDPSGTVPVTADSGIVFVLIPRGGGPREGPVAPFFLAKHELTRAQFDRLSPVPCPGTHTGADDPGQVADRTLPVEGVSRELAQRLLRAYGLRLSDEGAGGIRAARSITP